MSGNDEIFNVPGVGMFVQDDYASEGLFEEYSRHSFVVYSKREFNKMNSASRYTDYLQHLGKEYVNPYTGELVVD